MNKSSSYLPFDALDVPLEGSNLIEASAGTGKTYSIAILALRLLLEKQIPIQEILMVTFTKAAVAELQERIRLFIRLAHLASKGTLIADSAIAGLVQRAKEEHGEEKVLNLLNEAFIFLDETAVLTIHSFCQQVLNEFAFETGQLFGAELIQGTEELVQQEVNRFWRRKVTGLPVQVLRGVLQKGLSRGSLKNVVSSHLAGKKYLKYKPDARKQGSEEFWADLETKISLLKEANEEHWQRLEQEVLSNAEALQAQCNSHRYAAAFVSSLSVPANFLKVLWSKRGTKYAQTLFPDLLDSLEKYFEKEQELSDLLEEPVEILLSQAIQSAVAGVNTHKQLHNQLSFDDLIERLHQALVQTSNPRLKAMLLEKYKAVFIDEFQDTDRFQYEIFETAFTGESIVFFIGDPKQSIYAWRKADLFTYFKAKEKVNKLYSMNVNYRSSAPFIQAMNDFFLPEKDFDTFYFNSSVPSESGVEHAEKDALSRISYFPVEAPEKQKKGKLKRGEFPAIPLLIQEVENKEQVNLAVVAQLMDLLHPGRYLLETPSGTRGVKPADIGILIRSGFEGNSLKKTLSDFGFSAVLLSDEKILSAPEARYLLYLLQAIVDISIASINKALFTPLTNLSDSDLLTLNEELVIERFRNYKLLWEKEGVYSSLSSFLKDFHVRAHLLSPNTTAGERILSNVYQLIELLHRAQSTKHLSALELIGWLQRGIEGSGVEGDEFEQRIESDEDSLKIVTIHKSKGLEYNIVLAPFLDLKTKEVKGLKTFRDPETGEYVSLEGEKMSEAQKEDLLKQEEQENRRLIYVAITRAVYACFLTKNNSSRAGNSSLTPFYTPWKQNSNPNIQCLVYEEVPAGFRYQGEKMEKPKKPKREVVFQLLQPNWRKMSYSMLRAEHGQIRRLLTGGEQTEYDAFVFEQLAKGAHTGNMLHAIFENISFDSTNRWKHAVENGILKFAPLKKEVYEEKLMEMLDQVFNAKISIGEHEFCLGEIPDEKRIQELEFDFAVSPFHVNRLRDLSTEEAWVDVRNFFEIEGVMNGKVDLFFEHVGKYYVLDWKSNFLGNQLSEYDQQGLQRAMNDNNYHLQYLIYTLAIKKYLESRLPAFDYESQFGGVIYLFVRGVRKEGSTGIYTIKPALAQIEKLQALLEA